MADVITRLKVESTEYDSKIKRASQGLLQMEQACRKVGGTLAILEKDELEFVKGLGKMETVSKDARGQLSELTKAFTDLSLQYKRLTDEEKNGDFGKALASSLGELKTRIQNTKGQLNEINGEINGGGGLTGALDQLAGKFGMNIQQLAGWGAAIGAAKVALDVAKDAFFASEATVDEWGRVMDSSKSLYEGFLTAINTGDISGYLSSIDEIVSAARTAYDELDRLGTMKTIQAPQKSAQQTENDRIRQMIQTGHYIAPLDGRKPAPGMKDGQLLTPEQIRTLERQLQNGMKTVVGLVGNEVKQTGKAIDAVYERQAKELGMSLSEFRKGTSSWSEFEKRMNEAKDYQEFEAKRRQAQALASSGHNLTPEQSAILNAANPNQRGAKWATFRVDGDRYNELVQLILQRDQQAAQAYGMQSQAFRAINRAEGITTRSLLGGGSGGGKTGGGGSTTTVAKELSPMQQAQKEISALTEEALTADEGRLEVIKKEIAALQEQVRVYQSIQDYAQGKEPNWNIQVGDRKAFEAEQKQKFEANGGTASRLESMQYSVMKEMRVEDAKVDTETLHTLLKDALQNSIDTTSLDLTPIAEQIGEGINVPDEKWQSIIDKYNELRKQIGQDPIKINMETGGFVVSEQSNKKRGDIKNDGYQKMVGNISTITGAIQQLGVDIPEGFSKTLGIMQVISTILIAIQSLATVTATTSALKSIPIIGMFLNRGGIVHAAGGYTVPGNYGYDAVPAMLTSGEVVLNSAQQGVLASRLSENNSMPTKTVAVINGDQVKLLLMNSAQANGKTISEYLEIK